MNRCGGLLTLVMRSRIEPMEEIAHALRGGHREVALTRCARNLCSSGVRFR